MDDERMEAALQAARRRRADRELVRMLLAEQNLKLADSLSVSPNGEIEAHYPPRQDELMNFRGMRNALRFYIDLPEGDFSDKFLSGLLARNPDLANLATEHGWQDTEVREGLVQAISMTLLGAGWPTYGDEERAAFTGRLLAAYAAREARASREAK